MCLQSIPSTFRAACRVSTLCCLAAVLCIGKNILALGSKSLDWDGATAETLRESPRVRSKILELAMGSSPCKATASSRTCSLPSTALENTDFTRGEWRMETLLLLLHWDYLWALPVIMARDEPRTARAEEFHVHTMRDVQWGSDRPKTLAGSSLCHLAPGQHSPDEPTCAQTGNFNNFGPVFKSGFLLKSIFSQSANLTHIPRSTCLVLKWQISFKLPTETQGSSGI